MTAPAPAPSAAPSPAVQDRGPLPVEPARRLSPSPRRDRSWRVVLTVLGALVMALVLAAMVTSSVVGWAVNRGFTEVPATTALGAPSSLMLTTDVADIRVVHAEEAAEVSVALVASGATTLPSDDARARARVDVEGSGDAPIVEVRQPYSDGPIPWISETRDLLVVVPEGHQIDLDLSSNVGDIRAQGDFSSLSATSNVGEILLTAVSAPRGVHAASDIGDVDLDLADPVPGGVEVTSNVGDIEVRLAPDATGDLTITTDVGSATVEAPGTGRWSVDATSEVGEVRTDADLRDAEGPISGRMTIRANVGDVTITR